MERALFHFDAYADTGHTYFLDEIAGYNCNALTSPPIISHASLPGLKGLSSNGLITDFITIDPKTPRLTFYKNIQIDFHFILKEYRNCTILFHANSFKIECSNTGLITASIWNNAAWVSISSYQLLNLEEFYKISYRYNGYTFSLFIDGILENAIDVIGTIGFDITFIQLLSNGTNGQAKAVIDEFSIKSNIDSDINLFQASITKKGTIFNIDAQINQSLTGGYRMKLIQDDSIQTIIESLQEFLKIISNFTDSYKKLNYTGMLYELFNSKYGLNDFIDLSATKATWTLDGFVYTNSSNYYVQTLNMIPYILPYVSSYVYEIWFARYAIIVLPDISIADPSNVLEISINGGLSWTPVALNQYFQVFNYISDFRVRINTLNLTTPLKGFIVKFI